LLKSLPRKKLPVNFAWAFQMVLVVDKLTANAGNALNPCSIFLGQEDPLEESMAAHSSILAWRIPWTEEPGGLHFIRLQRLEND